KRVLVVFPRASDVRVREDVKHDRAGGRDRIRRRRMVVDRQTCSGSVGAVGRGGLRCGKGHEYIRVGKNKGNQRQRLTHPPLDGVSCVKETAWRRYSGPVQRPLSFPDYLEPMVVARFSIES